MIRYLFFSSLCIVAVLILFITSYDKFGKSEFEKDMVTTQRAMESMNWPLAERLLQGMLYESTDQARRWDIWLQLLEVRNNQSPYGLLTIEYLETMFTEFEDSEGHASIILEKLSATYKAMRQYENSYATLESHQALPSLTDEKRAILYQEMARVNILLEMYEMATENLQMCINLLKLPSTLLADCKYDLANISYIQGKYDEALRIAQEVFIMEDIPDALRGRAGFMVADSLSAQNKIQDALVVFTSIQQYYPNKLVITKQIEHLKSGKSKQSILNSFVVSPE